MALTLSTMLPLGTKAPDFQLVDVIDNQKKSLTDLKGQKATVIMFICNHCPFVMHIQDALVKLVNDYQNNDIRFIAINSNDIEKYPADSPEKMLSVAKDKQYSFPYLFDNTQEIAKAMHAACTPDFFIFDHELKCIYRGRFDDSRPGSEVDVTGMDLRNALEMILQNKPISTDQKPSMGCNIKWK